MLTRVVCIRHGRFCVRRGLDGGADVFGRLIVSTNMTADMVIDPLKGWFALGIVRPASHPTG